MLVELSVVEQRYQAVLAVIRDGVSIVQVARRSGVSRQAVHARTSLAVDREVERAGAKRGQADAKERADPQALFDARMIRALPLRGAFRVSCPSDHFDRVRECL